MGRKLTRVVVEMGYDDGSTERITVGDVQRWQLITRCEIDGPTNGGPGWERWEPTGRVKVDATLIGIGVIGKADG